MGAKPPIIFPALNIKPGTGVTGAKRGKFVRAAGGKGVGIGTEPLQPNESAHILGVVSCQASNDNGWKKIF
jgi:hypothetical protein